MHNLNSKQESIDMVGYNILPIGFSSFEKSTIETFFRLAGRRAPHWGLTARSSEARVLLFNATSLQDIESFRSLAASWQKVIIVGDSDFGTGWPVLPRPIKLTAILGLLDTIAKESEQKVDVTTPVVELAVAKPSATDVFAGVTSKVAKVEPIAAVKVPNLVPSPALVPMNEAPSFASSSQKNLETGNQPVGNVNATIGTVLIVDDSDIALKYMQNRLRHFGYESDMARSGDEALAMVASKSYQFVFLDVMMQGLDGYQTCRAIKNNKARRGAAPIVVMLTSRGGTIDKIRGTMAGCDAYMTKPLNEKQLTSVLAKFDDSTMTQRFEAANPRAPLLDTYVPVKR
jgi:two-component system, cell cycle response regulator